MRSKKKGKLRIVTGTMSLAVIALACILLVAPGVRAATRDLTMHLSEEAMLTFDPSPERAFEYGSRHFDAMHADRYDLDRAEALFDMAYRLDPSHPYVQHQKARIAFLEGDFGEALSRIDAELTNNPNPSSLYMRALIKGFIGDFEGAALDYEAFLRERPNSWAGINDYAWVLIQAERPLDALVALEWGLMSSPDNVWLLNNTATAHYELGQYELARDAAVRARANADTLTEAEWLQAYPGNDPLIAQEGIAALKEAIDANMHTITLALISDDESMR